MTLNLNKNITSCFLWFLAAMIGWSAFTISNPTALAQKSAYKKYFDGDFQGAEKEFEIFVKVSSSASKKAQYYKMMGVCQYMQGENEAARESFISAKKISPDIIIEPSEVLDETVIDYFESINVGDSEAEAQAKEEAEDQAREEAEAQAREDAEAQAREDAEAQAREDAEAQAREDAEAQAREDAEAEAEADAKAEAKLRAKARAKAKAKAKAKAEAEAEAEAEAKAKAKAKAEAKAKADTEARAKVKAKAKPKPKPKPKKEKAPEPDKTYLVVKVNRSNSIIFLDGLRVGKMGQKIKVDSGTRQLKIDSSGYNPITKSIDLKKDQVNVFNERFKRSQRIGIK